MDVDDGTDTIIGTIGARAAAKKRAKKDKKRRARAKGDALRVDAGYAPPINPARRGDDSQTSTFAASETAAATLALPSWDRRMRVVEIEFFRGPAGDALQQEEEEYEDEYGHVHPPSPRKKPSVVAAESFEALAAMAGAVNNGAANGGTDAGAAAEEVLPITAELAVAAEAVVRARGQSVTPQDEAAAPAAASAAVTLPAGEGAGEGDGDGDVRSTPTIAVAPTPVQAAVWGSVFGITPADIVAVSFTGSGKTLAFALPCLATVGKCYPVPTLKPTAAVSGGDGGDDDMPADPKVVGREAAAAVFVAQIKAGVPKGVAKKAAKEAYDKAAAAARNGSYREFAREQEQGRAALELQQKPRGRRPAGSVAQPCAIILAPTRELGQQIAVVIETLIAELPSSHQIASMCVVGGQDLLRQRQEMLATQPLLLVATPGRLLTLCGVVPESTRTRQTQDTGDVDDGGAGGAGAQKDKMVMHAPVCSLAEVSMFVLDEADRLLDLGFEEDVVAVRKLIRTPNPRTLMLSATWGDATCNLASTMLRPGAIRIQVGGAGLQAALTVTQRVEILRGKGAPRFRRLIQLITQYLADFATPAASTGGGGGGGDDDSAGSGAKSAVGGVEGGTSGGLDDGSNGDVPGTAAREGDNGIASTATTAAKILVFVLYKKEARDVAKSLAEKGFAVAAIQGDMSQSARQSVMDRFRSGGVDVLVGTDVAARGLDVTGVTHVINFSVGLSIDNYVHRIGRCGRAGTFGIAHTFVIDQDDGKVAELIEILERAKQVVTVELRQLALKIARAKAVEECSAMDEETQRIQEMRAENAAKQQKFQSTKAKKGGNGRKGNR